MSGPDSPPLQAGRREWAGLAVLSIATLLVSIDLFVLLLALPEVTADLGANNIEQLWITDIYGFLAGGLLITMGNIGDRIGRRKLLLIGAAAFGIASVLAAFSTSPEMLIGARALLGIAGATLGPSTLSLISTLFKDPKQMGVAIGVWGATFSIGAIFGPLIGGIMLEHFWWGSVFLLGVPAMVILLVFGPVLLPEARNPQPGRLDIPSVVLSLAAILPFIYGIKEIAREGWQVFPILAVLVGIVLGVIFVRRQTTLDDPLLDTSLFSIPNFRVGMIGLLSFGILGGASLLFITQYFQSVADLSSLEAGFALLPGMVITIAGLTLSPVLARTIRPAYLMSGGLMISVLGMVSYLQADATSGPWFVIVGFALASLGGCPLIALGMGMVMGSAPMEKIGAASALPQISNELGAAVGIATIGSLGAVVYRNQFTATAPAGVPAGPAAVAQESVAAANGVVAGLPADVGSAVLTAARDAFVSGFHTMAAIGIAVLVGIAALVLATLRQVPPLGAQPGTAPAEEEHVHVQARD